MDSITVSYFLQGIVLGIAYVAPIGMQNMYVINTALRMGPLRTFQVAAITTAFDISLALSCFFGVGLLLAAWPGLQGAMLLAGGILVVYFGARMMLSMPVAGEARVEEPLLKGAVACFVVTWLNPQAVLDGTMLLGGMRASLPAVASTTFMAGVATASCLWFSGLATATYAFKKSIDGRLLRWINVACGAVIALYGLKLGYEFVRLAFHW